MNEMKLMLKSGKPKRLMGMTITITAFITVTINTAIHNNY
jgi:hypothetical protein